jgi:hypothetical protein
MHTRAHTYTYITRIHAIGRRSARDEAYQLLAYGRWFSPGTPASSTTKTGRHDIAEILVKVVLKKMIYLNHNINIVLGLVLL